MTPTATGLQNVDWSLLPAPEDDGAARHLRGLRLASVGLPATDGQTVDLSALPGRVVVYVYPLTGRPGVELPPGWNDIPGARGCTPQSCAFRDHARELQAEGVNAIFGISTQSTAYQAEAVQRLHLPFPLLSDEGLAFARAMSLPMFEIGGSRLLKRAAFVADDGVITRVFYPVFPPDQSAAEVLAWIRERPA